MKLQTNCWPGLGSKEGLTGADKPISKMVHSHDRQVGSGYWREASVPRHVGISTEFSCVLTARQLASPRPGDPRESNAEATMSPMTLPGNVHIVISSIFYW